MKRTSLCGWLTWGLFVGLTGCAGTGKLVSNNAANNPDRPEVAGAAIVQGLPEFPRNARYLSAHQASLVDLKPKSPNTGIREPDRSIAANRDQHNIQPASHEPQRIAAPPITQDATLTIEGRTYRVQLVEEAPRDREAQPLQLAVGNSSQPPAPAAVPDPAPLPSSLPNETFAEPLVQAEPVPADALQLNLPTALSMVGGQHPAVGFAQWRVQEAYARLDQANVLWLPSLQTGFNFNRHDGNLQASDGSIADVNRNSFQFGLGAGAVGAGTTTRPGIVAQFHLADAIFQPEIAEKTAWARGHAANGVVNEQLLNVAVGYLDLLDAEQDVRIVEESQTHTFELSKLTGDFAATGQGLQADADRLETELRLVENRLASSRERVAVASARLSQTLSIDAGQRIVPLDTTVVPLELVSLELDKATLISTGLANRPELKESQALVVAACEQFKRQKYAPFVPSVLLGFSAGGFGGGVGNNLTDVNDRYDFDALLTWEVRNLGLGERAARRQTEAQIQQARFEKVRVLDRVAREVSEAHSQVIHRAQRITITQRAIQSAEDSYERNLSRIRDGQGLPLEVLQSVRALEDARRAYLRAVVEHNEAQFRLQWALGWPVFAPEATQ